MSGLYNLRHDGDQYRVTKFDADLNVESTYLMTETECQCPAGHRPSCRHRQMFHTLLSRINTDQFFNFDTNRWTTPTNELADEPFAEILHEHDMEDTLEALAECPAPAPKPEPEPIPAQSPPPKPFRRF